MESLLFQTGSGSIPVQSQLLSASPRHSVFLPVQGSGGGGAFSVESSSRISLDMEMSHRNIRRSYSELDVGRTTSKLVSRSFMAVLITEVECEEFIDERRGYADNWAANGISWEELSGGINNNRNSGGGGSGGNGNEDRHEMGAYYQQMLKSDPTNSLLLRNYAKYLHEVERDIVKAEEYYGRAILASPGDGEVLSLFGKLIWETQRDEKRAKSYFNQALGASPQDSTVLGSYAHFLWEAEDEDEEMMELLLCGTS